MAAIRRDLPEEFRGDFDEITRALREQEKALEQRIAAAAAAVASLSDRESGLTLPAMPDDVRPFLFAYRKAGGRVEGRSGPSFSAPSGRRRTCFRGTGRPTR